MFVIAFKNEFITRNVNGVKDFEGRQSQRRGGGVQLEFTLQGRQMEMKFGWSGRGRRGGTGGRGTAFNQIKGERWRRLSRDGAAVESVRLFIDGEHPAEFGCTGAGIGRGVVPRRHPETVFEVGVGALNQKRQEDGRCCLGGVAGGAVDRCPPLVVPAIDIGTVAEELFDEPGTGVALVTGGHMQRCPSVGVLGVGIAGGVEEHAHHIDVVERAPLRHQVDGCLPPLGDGVGVASVHQKMLHDLHAHLGGVLSRQMEWRAARLIQGAGIASVLQQGVHQLGCFFIGCRQMDDGAGVAPLLAARVELI